MKQIALTFVARKAYKQAKNLLKIREYEGAMKLIDDVSP